MLTARPKRSSQATKHGKAGFCPAFLFCLDFSQLGLAAPKMYFLPMTKLEEIKKSIAELSREELKGIHRLVRGIAGRFVGPTDRGRRKSRQAR
ncbi:exported hypothetical protein [Mesorhizobium metallidurans STM 2683]|uniref:Uncharacterized protein n=1 Tax=Mesorhizobium metallidurans STM 2683 TaxID=1297569 RepID=M5EUN9_9HYPH|nr:exported hypothetical protein [Mesorhizobium metallidurans STM 2683]